MVDYYSLISRAVSGLLINTDEARREIYGRACTALKERLRTLDPPISETQLANEQAASRLPFAMWKRQRGGCVGAEFTIKVVRLAKASSRRNGSETHATF